MLTSHSIISLSKIACEGETTLVVFEDKRNVSKADPGRTGTPGARPRV